MPTKRTPSKRVIDVDCPTNRDAMDLWSILEYDSVKGWPGITRVDFECIRKASEVQTSCMEKCGALHPAPRSAPALYSPAASVRAGSPGALSCPGEHCTCHCPHFRRAQTFPRAASTCTELCATCRTLFRPREGAPTPQSHPHRNIARLRAILSPSPKSRQSVGMKALAMCRQTLSPRHLQR